MKIKFATPVAVIKERDYGQYRAPAIVIYQKRELLMESHKVPFDSTVTSSHEYETTCVQYSYFLRINLWFVEIEFNWLGKNSSKLS